MIIFGVGVPIGILMLIIKNTLNIEDSRFFKYYIVFSIVIIALAVIINCIYQIKFCKRVNTLIKDLRENDDVDFFISEMQNLLGKSKSAFRKSILLINISYGYSKKGQYENALQTLEAIDLKTIKGVNNSIYNINKISFYFHLKNYSQVINLVEQYNMEFEKLQNHSQIAWNIEATKIYYNIAKGEIEEANKILQKAKEKWTTKEMVEEWKLIEERIAEY